MKIKSLHIKNFKSLVDVEIVDPNPFTVFVGANGVGKSNIFEAIEFVNYCSTTFFDSAVRAFGGEKDIANDLNEIFHFEAGFGQVGEIEEFDSFFVTDFIQGKALTKYYRGKGHNFDNQLPPNNQNFYPGGNAHRISINLETGEKIYPNDSQRQFFGSFTHLFIKAFHKEVSKYSDDKSLGLSASNLESVLKRLLQDENKKEDMLDWLRLFIPEFENVEVHSDDIAGTNTLQVYEKNSQRSFKKKLISDGTYNILCILTAVYQSDEPQFLCIEEPENGLTPGVIKEMVTLFRNACEEKGHYIWLNTHSQTLVSQLTSEEIITVDKIKGETKIKQFKGRDFHGLSMDEAWLTNSLGGGLPW